MDINEFNTKKHDLYIKMSELRNEYDNLINQFVSELPFKKGDIIHSVELNCDFKVDEIWTDPANYVAIIKKELTCVYVRAFKVFKTKKIGKELFNIPIKDIKVK